eukprot:TRINITY_DN22388_c1_g1_i1.p3 TRINITY_DN22388_c1_g1~~TRINITY_DN22388_c1_g1_i1.p3  ORF type:complete len:140 (+),score=43.21 TRINITY_DN22388_c1_g1_i1:410-829(+)
MAPAPLTNRQRCVLIRRLNDAGLLEVKQGSEEYSLFLSCFDTYEKQAEAMKDVINKKPATAKMLWVAEQAANPDKQPTLVRLPSGINIPRQTSSVDLKRSVSSKWEDRVLKVIRAVRATPPKWWLPSCTDDCCFAFMNK